METKTRLGHSRGVTLMEIAVALAIAAILLVLGARYSPAYGKKGRTAYEAGRVVDGLWELRSEATTGKRNPCMDFPDSLTVRLYFDTSSVPDGFGPGDRTLRSFAYQGGVRLLSVAGGIGTAHAVCFRSRGMIGSAATPLRLALGMDAETRKTVRLLPATGAASVQ